MKKYRFGLITLMSVFVLGACSKGNNNTDSTGAQGTEDTTANNVENMPLEVKNDGDPIEGETLDVAVVMEKQFQVLFQWEFYQDTYERQFMSPSHE